MKGNAVVFNGRKYSWCQCLAIVPRDLGLPDGKRRASLLAHRVAKQFGWDFTGSKPVIKRRTLEILHGGPPPKPRRTTVHTAGQSPKRRPVGAPHPEYVKDDGFYLSRAWKELRLEALRNMRNCQACGRNPSHGIVLHVDHIIPRYKDPRLSLVIDNLQVLCDECNIGKGAWDDTDFRHFKSI